MAVLSEIAQTEVGVSDEVELPEEQVGEVAAKNWTGKCVRA